MIRRPPRSTQSRSSAASDVYKRQVLGVEQLGDHAQPTEGLPLESRRSGPLVVESARVATIQLLADECIGHQPILAVEADGGTRTRACREGRVDLVVVDHHRVPI